MLFQYIYAHGELPVKALAVTRKFGPDLYRVLDRAARVNLLTKRSDRSQTFYSINPELKSALEFVMTEEPRQ